MDNPETIYIVEEAQLLFDSYRESELFIFGSGKLLQDFIEFTQISDTKGRNRKIIFIGDDKQILRDREDLSAMSEIHLRESYQLKTQYFELDETLNNEEKQAVIDNASIIRKSIIDKQFNYLTITTDNDKVFCPNKDDFKELYLSKAYQDSIFIEFSNKQVNKINLYIRKILRKKGSIDKGDWISLYNNITKFDTLTEREEYFSNGEFAEVIDFSEVEVLPIKVKNKEIQLNFREIHLRFRQSESQVVSLLSNENFFLSEESDMNKDEQIAIKILANKNFYNLSNQDKFKYLISLSKIKGLQNLEGLEENISLSKDDFKTELGRRKLLRPLREYYLRRDKYLNAAKLRFAYSMTCHRAQGYEWKNVFINCETGQGQTSESYFRWIYTAITRSKSNLYLFNPPEIFPIMGLTLNEAIQPIFDNELKLKPVIGRYIISDEVQDLAIKFNFPNDKLFLKEFLALIIEKLKDQHYTIDRIEHLNYLERYFFFVGQEKLKLDFYYNKAGNFKKPQPSKPLEKEIINLVFQEKHERELIDLKEKDFPLLFLHDFYKRLLNVLQPYQIEIHFINHNNHAELYHFVRDKEISIWNFYYTKEGFLTSAIPTKYNSPSLLEDIKNIINKKSF